MQQRANKIICIITPIIQININYSDKYLSSEFCQNKNVILLWKIKNKWPHALPYIKWNEDKMDNQNYNYKYTKKSS